MNKTPFNILRHTEWDKAPRDPVTGIGVLAASLSGATSGLAFYAAYGAISLGISAVTSWALSALAPKPDMNNAAGSGLKTNVRDPAADLEIVYGTIRKGGIITYLEGEPSTTNGYLSMIIVLAGHEVEEIGQIYINDEPVTLNGSGFVTNDRWTVSTDGTPNKIQIFKYDGSQTVPSSELQSHSELVDTDTNFIGRETAYLYVRMKYDTSVFSGGIPTFTAVVKGKKVYDPRLNSGAGGTAWSANAALCTRDYLTSYYGLDEPDSAIDDTVFTTAANVCDESVTLGTGYLEGATEKRYEINGVLSANDTPENNLQKMMTACAGTLYWGGGLWKLKPGYYVAPTVSLGLGDVRGPLNVETRTSRRDNFNIVRGTFVNYAPNAPDPAPWRTEDYPEIKSATFITEDNEIENPLDLTLPLTTSLAMAQRLAKMTLFRGREQMTMNVDFSVAAFEVQVGEVIQFTNSRYGWTNKEFEVTSWKFYIADGGELKVNLGLRETSEAAFDWDAEEADIIGNNSNLPSYNAGMAITNFSAANAGGRLRKDGTWLPRVELTWDAVDSTFIYEYDIRYKINGEADTEYTYLITRQNSAIIRGLSDEQTYYFEVRARNYAGYSGAWVSDTLVVLEDTTAPSVPTSLTATGTFRGIRVSWVNPTDEDLRHVEVWNAGVKIAEVTGTEFLHVLSTGDSESYTVRSVDFSGNVSSFTSASNTATAGTLGSADIGAGEVGSDELADDAVTKPKIADSAVGVAALAEANVGGNLVPDGIMREQDTALWDTSSASVSFVSGGISGAGALAITLGSGLTDCYAQTTQLSSIESGETYALRIVWLGSSTVSAAASLEVNYYDASGSFLSTSREISSKDLSSVTWSIEEATFTAPSNARFIGFRPVADGTVLGAAGILYVDTIYCAKQIRSVGLGTSSVSRTQIQDGEVIEGKIGPLAVTEGKLGPLAVTEGKIGSLAVTKGKIGNNAVGVAKLAEANTGGNLVPDGIMREQDSDLWSLSNSTLSFVSGGLSGAGALAMTTTAASDCSVQTTQLSSIESGETYALRVVWLGSVTVAASASIIVNYYDASQGFLSSSTEISLKDISSVTWTIEEAPITAPSNARFVGFRVQVNSSFGSGNILYVDTLYCAKQLRSVGLGTNSVVRDKILDGEIIEGKIGPLAVTEGKLASLAVTNGKIASATIENDRLFEGAFYFRRGNALGTVSKTAGIPTGSIVETGANANGYYEKLMNGRMMCWHRVLYNTSDGNNWSNGSGGLFISGSVVTWTFPTAYLNATGLFNTAAAERAGGEAIGASLYDFSSTQARYRGWASASLADTDTKYVNYFSVGRWDTLS